MFSSTSSPHAPQPLEADQPAGLDGYPAAHTTEVLGPQHSCSSYALSLARAQTVF